MQRLDYKCLRCKITYWLKLVTFQLLGKSCFIPVWNTHLWWISKSTNFLIKLFWYGSDTNYIWGNKILHMLFSDEFFHERKCQRSFLCAESTLLCQGERQLQLILKSSRLFFIKWWSQQQRWGWREPHKVCLMSFFKLLFSSFVLHVSKYLEEVGIHACCLPLKLVSIIYVSCN